MGRLTRKCSTILISVGEKTEVFRSVDEVPPELRERLIETTQGIHSATILIADKGGREEILRTIREREPADESRLAALTEAGARRRRLVLTWNGLGRLLVLGSLGYILWVLISVR